MNGALSLPYTGSATSFTLTAAHQSLRHFGSCSCISIPQLVTCPGRLYTVINSNGTGSSDALTVQTSGTTYDDVTAAFISILAPNNRLSIQRDGTNPIVVER